MKRERDDALKKLDTVTKDVEGLGAEGEQLRDMLDEKSKGLADLHDQIHEVMRLKNGDGGMTRDCFAFLPVPVTSAIFRRFARASVVILE